MTPPTEFPEPSSIAIAEKRISDLLAQIGNIDMQLGDRNRKDVNGRLPPAAYFAWRTRSLNARIHRVCELRFLKHWVLDQRHKRASALAGVVDGNDPISLLAGAERVLTRLSNEVPFDPQESALLVAIKLAVHKL